VLARRLLRAWLRLRDEGARAVMVFGAGSHTAALLRWGLPDRFELKGLVATRGTDPTVDGLSIRDLHECSPDSADALLLSSVSYEPEMLEAARARGWRRIVPLYSEPLPVMQPGLAPTVVVA
jgi:hypothetical protein